jgi:hypothetical protein
VEYMLLKNSQHAYVYVYLTKGGGYNRYMLGGGVVPEAAALCRGAFSKVFIGGILWLKS